MAIKSFSGFPFMLAAFFLSFGKIATSEGRGNQKKAIEVAVSVNGVIIFLTTQADRLKGEG
ncbi:MAG: hypothetical protein JRI80_20030 [Deltaproteobacteria bacterium]|nr:hypothetical protein [Deltaproteobacteria bacterium]